MSRSLTIHEPAFNGDTWKAFPSPETTVAELQLAIDGGFGLEVSVWDGEGVVLIAAPWAEADPNWTPPKVEDLARVMFDDPNPTLVIESGVHRTLDEETLPVG